MPTYTPRLSLPLWAGTEKLLRSQMNAAHNSIDTLAAIDLPAATTNDVPPPSSALRGAYCAVADIGAILRCDGTRWVTIVSRDTRLSDAPPVAEAYGAAGAAGTSQQLSRADHQHPMPKHDGPAHNAIPLSALASPTGAVRMGGQRLTGLPAPQGATEPATKAYVDAKVAEGKTWTPWVQIDSNVKVRTALGGTLVQISGALGRSQVPPVLPVQYRPTSGGMRAIGYNLIWVTSTSGGQSSMHGTVLIDTTGTVSIYADHGVTIPLDAMWTRGW